MYLKLAIYRIIGFVVAIALSYIANSNALNVECTAGTLCGLKGGILSPVMFFLVAGLIHTIYHSFLNHHKLCIRCNLFAATFSNTIYLTVFWLTYILLNTYYKNLGFLKDLNIPVLSLKTQLVITAYGVITMLLTNIAPTLVYSYFKDKKSFKYKTLLSVLIQVCINFTFLVLISNFVSLLK